MCFGGRARRVVLPALRLTIKHNLDHDFPFDDYITICVSSDVASVMGITWWMWVVAVIRILLECVATAAAAQPHTAAHNSTPDFLPLPVPSPHWHLITGTD